MTTYIIYSDTNAAFIQSKNTSMTTALAGSAMALNTHPTIIATGMNTDTSGRKYVYEAFLSFDTSVIDTTEEIVDVSMVQYSGWTANAQTVAWGQQWYIHNWTAPLTTAQWINPTTFRSRQDTDIAVNFDILEKSTPYRFRFSGRDRLISGISKTAATKFVVVSNTAVMGMAPTGTQELWMERGARRPYMVVYTTAQSALNSLTLASTDLPDGTTVSIRSNGAATPTYTLGYAPLNGSWTSLGALNSTFARNISGPSSVTLVSDPDGNFYVIGIRNGVKDGIAGQAYKRLTATTWQAKTVLTQNIPAGNEQSIRAISASYVTANRDSKDAPNIYVMTSRGASGTRPNFPNHTGGVGGGGWTQDTMLFSENLLKGSGALISGSVNGYSPHTATGLPVFNDVISIDGSVQAVYVQRGRFSNIDVGGISTINIWARQGFTLHNDSKYVATGASKLVPVDTETFAHVFDNQEDTTLTVRFYNKRCQILGEAKLPASNFNGGVIGEKWAASFDKVSNVIRVYLNGTAATNTVSRWDVSPATYAGTFTASAGTIGAAGSTNSIFRTPSGRTDERRVMIESANLNGTTKSMQNLFSTAGNKVPSAPVQGVRTNFDATSAATFTWTFSDGNPADTQLAYQVEISSVDTGAIAHDTGRVVGAASSHTLAANVLTNGTNYRWRVRTYDAINAAGTWSGYQPFTTSATGTVSITAPASNSATFDTSYFTLRWTYVQSGGQTQAARRVVLTRIDDNSVVLDTGMQNTTATSYNMTNLSSGVNYRVDVSVRNSGNIVTPAASRTFMPYYSEPMAPEMILRALEEYIEIQVINPIPLGSRPEVAFNDIYRRIASESLAPWTRIATIENNETYRDYHVKSGVSYEYQIVGRTL